MCAATNVLVGSLAGYRSAGSYLACWLAAVLVAVSARSIVGYAWGDARGLERSIRVALAACAIVVGPLLVVGAAGRLTLVSVLLAQAVVCGAALSLPRARSPHDALTVDAPPAVIGVAAALIAFAVAFGATHAPFTLYDSLSYHLFFAARWVQDHAIAIIPTPFSDVAQAYAPGNGELVFAWLMLPFRGDLLARMGQLPFAIVGALTLMAIGRRLGAAPAHAVYPAAFFLLSRPVVEQMVGSNVDLICAAFFLVSFFLILIAVDTDRGRDWAIAGVSVGLYAGTKYLALVYLPVLIVAAFAQGPRLRALWSLPGIVAFAAPWYLRNWIVAGSPIYPSTVTVAGVTIARGAFTRAAMLNTIFHTTDVRLIPAMAAHAFGPTLFVVWLPCAIGGGIVLARRGWWPHGVAAIAPWLMLPLFWFGLPVNVDSRFLLPAIGVALLPFAFLFSRDRRWNGAVHAGYACAMAWTIVGMRASLPATVPWFMDGWLSLGGLVPRAFLVWFAVTAIVLAGAWQISRRSPRHAVPAFACALVTCAAALTIASARRCDAAACAVLDTTPTYIRAGYIDAWQWIDANISNATVAYTGINLPYPLTGSHLANRVVYVNIDGRPRWRFHDYDRAFRAGRFAPAPPLLATSSGELMPVVARSGPRDDALRPRYERMQGIRDAWMFNLETMNVRYVFVAMLSAYEIDYVWHNERGFPIEDEWALADPARFHLVYTNPQVHIYAVDAGWKASA